MAAAPPSVSLDADDPQPATGRVFTPGEIDAMRAEAVPDKATLARLIAKVLTFVADALQTAVTSLRTSAANDPVEALAPVASDKPAPSATEMEEAPASADRSSAADDRPDVPDPNRSSGLLSGQVDQMAASDSRCQAMM